ncbi:hypothetical protein SLEP1_g14007 [Rubroshorea leprosula]|uniref:Uncharacterized protein n=1 Tax=Rubroshorea leprosula TaxID=152421 RepID=A0AAV5IS53_9ROSI|nr:hypothetical protein SLEP1_g14007 [Rubroshorea leprosula]
MNPASKPNKAGFQRNQQGWVSMKPARLGSRYQHGWVGRNPALLVSSSLGWSKPSLAGRENLAAGFRRTQQGWVQTTSKVGFDGT